MCILSLENATLLFVDANCAMRCRALTLRNINLLIVNIQFRRCAEPDIAFGMKYSGKEKIVGALG